MKVERRALSANEIMFGGIWIGPGSGDRGDGHRPDLGQTNADATVQAALDAGILDFDTAPWYGAGASEERLGRALSKLAPGAHTITKAGRLFSEADGTPALFGFDTAERAKSRVCSNDYSAAGTDKSLAHSLDRLGLSSVYGLRIHDPNDNSLNSRAAPSGTDEVAQVYCACATRSVCTPVQRDASVHLLGCMVREGLVGRVTAGLGGLWSARGLGGRLLLTCILALAPYFSPERDHSSGYTPGAGHPERDVQPTGTAARCRDDLTRGDRDELQP